MGPWPLLANCHVLPGVESTLHGKRSLATAGGCDRLLRGAALPKRYVQDLTIRIRVVDDRFSAMKHQG